MSEGQSIPPKKSHSKNDNCENCIKQRVENQKFIKVYERLQDVTQKTYRVRQAVQDHKASSETNRSFYKNFDHKVTSLPKAKKEVNTQMLENVGFELAASVLEKESKKKVVEENERLKFMINNMRREKWEQKEVSSELMKTSCFTQKNEKTTFEPIVNKLQRTFNSCQTPKPGRLSQTQMLESMLLSNQSEQNYQQNTTQSSSFKEKTFQTSMDLGRYSDLNLWLYQSDKNAKLEEQLYIPGKSKTKSFVGRGVLGRNLPTIRIRK